MGQDRRTELMAGGFPGLEFRDGEGKVDEAAAALAADGRRRQEGEYWGEVRRQVGRLQGAHEARGAGAGAADPAAELVVGRPPLAADPWGEVELVGRPAGLVGLTVEAEEDGGGGLMGNTRRGVVQAVEGLRGVGGQDGYFLLVLQCPQTGRLFARRAEQCRVVRSA